jgi:hypothetical protein
MPDMRSALLSLMALATAGSARAETKKDLPPESTFMRTAHAARWVGAPIVVDGRMDEPSWQAAPLEDSFTQVAPDEGKPASVHTAFRVLWDDEYLYFGAVCDDDQPPVATLSRRDRFIEGDSIQFDLDTTLDRRTAYHFQVFAAGQQLDALHFNDTDFTTDWDAAWESAVARTDKGWSVEMKIPLRVLRIPVGVGTMGFNVYRILSRRHEEDQWRYRPNGRPGDISRLGLIEGLQGIHPVRELELRPYVAAKYLRNVPSHGKPHAELGSCATLAFDADRQGGVCAGLDLRYNLASDLALVGTLNPDFGQVEADQRVLNLTTFETFFPEKRPFFLEGLDLFKLPMRTDIGGPYGGDAYQIFYSRRIGRGTPSHDDLSLGSDQTIVYQQPSVPVLGAAKLSGTIAGASVGMLSAVEPRVTAQVLQAGGPVSDLRTVEARTDSVLRVRAPLGERGFAGVTGTAVDPIFTSPAGGLERRHAHVGEGDVIVYTADRSWDFTAQGLGSLLTLNEPGTLRDGTNLGTTASGWAASARLHRSEEYWASAVYGDWLSPSFTVNDLGYMPRANLGRTVGYFALRDPHANSIWQSSQLFIGGKDVHDFRFANRLARDGFVEVNLTDKSFWFWDTGVDLFTAAVDDRELADGTPLQRQGYGYWYGFISTDSRKPLQLQLSWTEGRAWPRFERTNQLELYFVIRPLPQLDGSLDLSYNENAGSIRKIRTAGPLPGAGDPTATFDRSIATQQTREYLLAAQHARSVSATLRATWAFTPRLTLQGYAQLFTAGISYGTPLRAVVGPGRRTVTLDELRPATAADQAPNQDDRQAGLNVNLILRWEWRTGSTFYLVYAHQSSNDFTPPQTGLDFHRELSALSDRGVAHGDTVLVKMDLLSAL